MTDQPTTEPILTVTWDTVIGQVPNRDRYDEDGPAYEPVSLGDAVVDAIVHRLIGEIRNDIRKSVLAAVTPVVQAEIGSVVREALAAGIRKTNTWGEPQGETQTLRELLAAQVNEYLSEVPRENRNGYSGAGPRPGGFRELVSREIDDAMSKDLRQTIVEARADVAKKVRTKAAEMIGSIVESTR